MRAARLFGKENLRVQDVARPEISDNEVLVQVKCAFVCGTDVRMWLHGHARASEESPLILGHEFSGVIAQLGKQVAGYREGMRVTVAPNMGCGICPVCISGNTQFCLENFQALGVTMDGGFAEYIKIPEAAVRQGNMMELPVEMTFEQAALVEPLSCAFNGFEHCHIAPGNTVLVVGAGPIGIMHARLAKMAGAAQVLIHDLSENRLELCRQADAFFTTLDAERSLQEQIPDLTNGSGVDVTITACPVPSVQIAALEVAALNGRVLFFGGLPAAQAIVGLNTNIIHYKQLLVTGTTRSSLSQYLKTLQLVAGGLIKVDDLVTSRTTLDNIHSAIDGVSKGIGLKSAILFG